jgi:hypothetical protein
MVISPPNRPADPPPEPERYGPLVVERIVKEDGRSLIRFSREVAAEGERQ